MADDGGNMRFMAGIEKDAKAKTMKDASLDDLLGEISARMEDKEQAVAFMNKRVNEFAKSNARLTEENQRLKAADAERKRLLVRKAALEEEVSKLRGQLSQETKKRKELEEAVRNATERDTQYLEEINDLRREVCLLYGQMADMAEAEQASTEQDKDEIIREQIDRLLAHIEEHVEENPKERAPMKSMLYDLFWDKMTDGQRKRLAALDRRGAGQPATRIDVHAGGMYNANVERQALDAPVKRTWHDTEQGWISKL